MRSQTVKISPNLKVKKFTDVKLSDFNSSYVSNYTKAQGAYVFSKYVNGLCEADGYIIRFERNRSVFRLVQNDSKLNVEDIVAGVKERASELGSGTIAITDLAPYYYRGEIRICSGIGIFYEGDINVEVLRNLIHRIYNQKY